MSQVLVETKDLVQVAKLATAFKVEPSGDRDSALAGIASIADQPSIEERCQLAERRDCEGR